MGKFLKRVVLLCVFIGVFYILFGFFVVKPLGIFKDGATVLYFRLGLNTKFITSVDGILIDRSEDLSLPGRLVVLGKVGEVVNERKIASFPYSRTLHQFSTNGIEFKF